MSAAPIVNPRKTADGTILSLVGGWVIGAGSALETGADGMIAAAQGALSVTIDLSAVEQLDTAGAWVIDRARAQFVAAGQSAGYAGARPEFQILLREAGYRLFAARPPVEPRTAVSLLASVGESVAGAGDDLVNGVGFLGRLVSVVVGLLPYPGRWRWTSATYHLEMFSLRSAPIILLINFLVGAIVSQQGIFQLARFGATPYVVDLIGVLVLRELGVLLTSIMIAGRSGSAITAEIGSMNMREEIDALRVMALDPMEVLVLPRIVALMAALPILTFLADMAALFGGLLRRLGLWRHQPGCFPVAAASGDRRQHLPGRPHQGAVHGPRHRTHRLGRGFPRARLGRIARAAGDGVGGQLDLHGHRGRRAFRDVLRRGALLSVAPETTAKNDREVVIRVRGLKVGFGDKLVMDGLDLDLYRGEVLGFVGASGAGKSVLTRTILGLLPKRAGTIEVYGRDIDTLTPRERLHVGERWGVLFQQGALFSSLTVRQNIQAPIREHLGLSGRLMDELAMQKLALVGLPEDAADKFPSELSGGMIKRAALARALALDPDLVFLDEPTSGLDPIGAGDFDELISTLQKTLGLTVFMVTHDLDSLYAICDRVAALGHGRVTAVGPIEELLRSDDPWLKAYFHGKRGINRGAAPLAKPKQGRRG